MSEIKRNTDPLAELPEGLGMALARNFPCLLYTSSCMMLKGRLSTRR